MTEEGQCCSRPLAHWPTHGGVSRRAQRLKQPLPPRAPVLALTHRQSPPLAAPPLQNGRTSSSRGDAPSEKGGATYSAGISALFSSLAGWRHCRLPLASSNNHGSDAPPPPLRAGGVKATEGSPLAKANMRAERANNS